MSSQVNTFRDVLLHELSVGVRTTSALVGKIGDDHWSFRPSENMRTLLELANHVTQVPLGDLAILQEQTQEEVQQLERDLTTTQPEAMVATLERGYAALAEYMNGLSEDDFLNKSTKPFYLEHSSTQVKWLVEIVTHLFHHRAQLFTYMKQLGIEVNMFDLY